MIQLHISISIYVSIDYTNCSLECANRFMHQNRGKTVQCASGSCFLFFCITADNPKQKFKKRLIAVFEIIPLDLFFLFTAMKLHIIQMGVWERIDL